LEVSLFYELSHNLFDLIIKFGAKMSDLDDYLTCSAKAMFAACIVYDNARSAEKMADWGCVGEDNKAWRDGPYLSAPPNRKQIDRSHPYCFKTSPESEKAAFIVMGSNPKKCENGGVRIPLPPKGAGNSIVEPIISKLAILEQFELFKRLMKKIDGPYNKKIARAWKGRVDCQFLSKTKKLVDRRDSLVHDHDYDLATMREAVDYLYSLREIAKVLCAAHANFSSINAQHEIN